ncbi:MAG: cysteine hydrolase [Pseudomonadales bacterium]|nr:cysteine hydrolase [Pseudomonadales bacterium]
MADRSVTIDDILGAVYAFEERPAPATRANTVLLLIDIQVMASADYLLDQALSAGFEAGVARTALANYKRRFDAAVDRCAELLSAARAHGVRPIHVKIEALAGDAADTGAVHGRLGWRFPPGANGSAFLPPVAPEPGEIVLTKTCSGAFNGTILDTVLRNLGITHLIVCGFVTDECVETTARVALDLGYLPRIVADATTTYHDASARHVLGKFGGWGLTTTAAEVRALFAGMPD